MGEETLYSCLHSYLILCEKLEECEKDIEQLKEIKNNLELSIEVKYDIGREVLWKILRK